MSRVEQSERRRHERASGVRPKAATPQEARPVIDEAFTDRISWKAARVILVRIVNDSHYAMLDEGLRGSIERFIGRHPSPVGDKPPVRS